VSDMVARLRLDAAGGAQAAGEVGKVEDALRRVGPAGEAAAAGAAKAGAAVDHAGDQAQAAASDFATLYDASQRDFVSQYNAQLRTATGIQNGAAASSRQLTLAALGLSRQFADVGVTAAMGMNPLMILIQQGPQIADQMALMKMQGLGLSQVMRSLAASTWAALAPLAPFLAAGAALAAVVGGGLLLTTRALNQEHKDFAKSLGLSEKQMERLKKSGVDTGITIGDVFKGTFTYIRDGLAPILAPIGKWFSDLFDLMTKRAVSSIKSVVANFAGGFAYIKAIWKDLPAVLGDLAVSAANLVIAAIERMVNLAIGGLNKLIDFANAAARKTGVNVQIGQVGAVQFGRQANDNAGAAARANERATAAGTAAGKKAIETLDSITAGWTKAVLKAGEDRIRKGAGDPDKVRKAPAVPRDQTDERTAQIDALLAQAMQEELQARLAITREAKDRAKIEKQLLAAQLAEKKAQVDRQIASIADDKGLSQPTKDLLTAQLEQVKIQQGRTAGLVTQAIDEATAAQLAREALDLNIAGRENHIDLLAAQADLTKSAYARGLIEIDILKAQHEIERLKLEEVVASATSTATEKAIAQARLGVLGQIQALEVEQAKSQTRLVDAVGEAADAASRFRSALKRHDWASVFDELQSTIQTIQASFKEHGIVGAVGTAASAIGSAIGGKTGRAVSSAANAGMTTLMVTGNPIIAAAAAALAGLTELLKSKPSNAGAGLSLVTGQFSGKSRTPETERAAQGAADAIRQGEAILKAAGITLGATVHGLVIGTRDLSQVYLTNGQTVTSAVGDAAAAAEAGLKAMLGSATFASDAQKTLVEGMLAAGKGFDDISAALRSYADAQKIAANIDDMILQLTDPKAWALEELKRAQKDQRDALKAAADAGYLTAAQFEAAGAKLTQLEGLQLADTLKRLEEAAGDAADALSMKGSVQDRILELTNPNAYKVKRVNDDINATLAEAQPLIAAGLLGEEFLGLVEQLRGLELQRVFAEMAGGVVDETAKAFQEARPRMLAWLDELRAGPASELSPKAARAEALQQYQREYGKAQAGDPTSIANLLTYASRLLEADKLATSSAGQRLSLRNQVMGQVEGLAGRGLAAETSPAAAIATLQIPLTTIAQAASADLAAAAAGGKAVIIANLPSMQAMYGNVLTLQTDRLVAANDRSREEIVAALKAGAERTEQAFAALASRLDGALAEVAAAGAAQAGEIVAGFTRLENEQRLIDARQRALAS